MLSRKVEYGLMALLHMDATPSESVVSSKEIAEKCEFPVDLMGKVMQSLARGSLIEAVHGARGGYRLVRDLDTISLGDVIKAIEGPVHLVRCQHDAEDCHKYSNCMVREPLNQLRAQLDGFLHNISLGQFRKQPTETCLAGG
ncbi:MAG TPA: Rrf2 family transcriptional regulator [Kiritimatiellia bacterium]|nr:Rrf2 family transcriptional regulator [Kiritimatiellia bacterium]